MIPKPDTQKVISEGGNLSRLTSSPEWVTMKRYLNDKFVVLDSWSSLPEGMNDGQKMKEMQMRTGAIALVQEWVSEMEGRAHQGQEMAKTLIDRKNISGDIFSYFPETGQRSNNEQLPF